MDETWKDRGAQKRPGKIAEVLRRSVEVRRPEEMRGGRRDREGLGTGRTKETPQDEGRLEESGETKKDGEDQERSGVALGGLRRPAKTKA